MLVAHQQQTSYLGVVYAFIWSFFSWGTKAIVAPEKKIIQKWPPDKLIAHFVRPDDQSEQEYQQALLVRGELFSLEDRPEEETRRTYNLWI